MPRRTGSASSAVSTDGTPRFFGSAVFGSYGPSLYSIDARLAKLTKAKAFPKNVLVEYQAPRQDGRIVRITSDIGDLAGTPGYKPRAADSRVGYFYNSHEDYAKPANRDITERYINRWHLEKADPKLKLSPPKQPIVWYIEHTTPIHFRRYVREGIEMWNQAYREIGQFETLQRYGKGVDSIDAYYSTDGSVPDLKRYGSNVEVRAELSLAEPITVNDARGLEFGSSKRPSDNA